MCTSGRGAGLPSQRRGVGELHDVVPSDPLPRAGAHARRVGHGTQAYREVVAERTTLIGYAAAMVLLIVALDILLLRDHAWARLLVNVGIVLVFGGFYLRFMRPS